MLILSNIVLSSKKTFKNRMRKCYVQFSRLSFAYLKINNLNSHLFAEVTCYVPQNLQNHYYTNKKSAIQQRVQSFVYLNN